MGLNNIGHDPGDKTILEDGGILVQILSRLVYSGVRGVSWSIHLAV
ncbi:MAG TPA: hypothetical protein VJ551_04150 [Nitrososphaeraceae archaeon]|nr:hypothetical protein [Nitrososphaeraceae archaeon]